MEPNTGATYPTVELGGVLYEVKFTRSMIYRMDKAGIKFSPEFIDGGKGGVKLSFSNLVDVLKVAIDFPGTADELSEMAYDKRNAITTILMNAWGNLLRSSKAPVATAQPEAQLTEPLQ